MATFCGWRRITAWLLLTALAATLVASSTREAGAGEQRPQRPRMQIGEVLGKPVYRDEIHLGTNGSTEEDELHRLFADPVLKKYCEAHRSEVEPTPAELAEVEAFLEKRARNPDRTEENSLREQLKKANDLFRNAKLTEHARERLETKKILIEHAIEEAKSEVEARRSSTKK